jgi:hypothetical protein
MPTGDQKEAWLVVVLLFVFTLISFAGKAVIGIAALIRPERDASRWTNDRPELAIRPE